MRSVNILTTLGAEGHAPSRQRVQRLTGSKPLFATESLHLGRDIWSHGDRRPHTSRLVS